MLLFLQPISGLCDWRDRCDRAYRSDRPCGNEGRDGCDRPCGNEGRDRSNRSRRRPNRRHRPNRRYGYDRRDRCNWHNCS